MPAKKLPHPWSLKLRLTGPPRHWTHVYQSQKYPRLTCWVHNDKGKVTKDFRIEGYLDLWPVEHLADAVRICKDDVYYDWSKFKPNGTPLPPWPVSDPVRLESIRPGVRIKKLRCTDDNNAMGLKVRRTGRADQQEESKQSVQQLRRPVRVSKGSSETKVEGRGVNSVRSGEEGSRLFGGARRLLSRRRGNQK